MVKSLLIPLNDLYLNTGGERRVSEKQKVKTLTDENFDTVVKNSEFVIIDCWAPWCGPCRMFSPIIDELAEKYPKITFGKLNTDENSGITQRFGIMSIPTTLVFQAGRLIDTIIGAVPKSIVEEKIQMLR